MHPSNTENAFSIIFQTIILIFHLLKGRCSHKQSIEQWYVNVSLCFIDNNSNNGEPLGVLHHALLNNQFCLHYIS